MLSPEELKRYNRHIILPEVGMEGQKKLKQAKVLVVGAGGLGCPVLLYLTAAGVGTIGIIDDDVVNESNLQRQILYDNEDIGSLKANKAAEKLNKLNPFVDFKVFLFRLSRENVIEIFKEFDLIIDGSDNFSTRYLVNDACLLTGKPLVFGSIFKFEGQVTVFNYFEGPTYRCLFPEPPNAEDVPNCSEIGVLGVLPGIIGTLQANEAIKIITGVGEVLSGKLFVIDALTMVTQTYKYAKVEANRHIAGLIDYDEFCNVNQAKDIIKEMDVFQLKEMLDKGEEIQLVDVRNEDEYELCRIGDLLIPMNTIPGCVDKISTDKKVIIYCHHGMRSAHVIKYLQENYSFTNLYNLTGGIHQWALNIDPQMEVY